MILTLSIDAGTAKIVRGMYAIALHTNHRYKSI